MSLSSVAKSAKNALSAYRHPQQKSFTLRGRRYRLDPKVPAAEIRYAVNRTHVGESDRTIIKLVWSASRRWPSVKLRKQAVRYALAVHDKNRKLVQEFRL